MLIEKINADIKKAMIEKDKKNLSVLRSILAEFKNEAINLKKKDDGLNDEEAINVVKRQAKKHKDSISQYTAANREDLVEEEVQELKIIQKYLPEEMPEEEIKKIVRGVIDEMGEILPSDFGKVMKSVMEKIKGNADGALVSKVVKETINN